jgi:hypothetical protein
MKKHEKTLTKIDNLSKSIPLKEVKQLFNTLNIKFINGEGSRFKANIGNSVFSSHIKNNNSICFGSVKILKKILKEENYLDN